MKQEAIEEAEIYSADMMDVFTAKGADPGYTIEEVASITGLDASWVRRQLNALVARGKLEKRKLRHKDKGGMFLLYELTDKGKT